jgi:hypothetical protein
MGTLFVDKLDPQSGTSLEIGSSGDTITIPSGATITNNGTQTGFGGDLTPAFSAYVGTATVLTDATMTTIKYDTENFDTDNAFDTSTYTFTVPSGEGGKYYFSVRMEVEAGGNNRYDNFYIRLRKGSSTIKEIHYYPGGADSPRTNTWELNCTATLAAADEVKVQVYMDFNAGAPQVQAYSTSSEFAGFKILGA